MFYLENIKLYLSLLKQNNKEYDQCKNQYKISNEFILAFHTYYTIKFAFEKLPNNCTLNNLRFEDILIDIYIVMQLKCSIKEVRL